MSSRFKSFIFFVITAAAVVSASNLQAVALVNPEIKGLVGVAGDPEMAVGQMKEVILSIANSSIPTEGTLTLDITEGDEDAVEVYLPNDCDPITLPHTWSLPLADGVTFPMNIKVLALARENELTFEFSHENGGEEKSNELTIEIKEQSFPISTLLPAPQEISGSKYRKIALNGSALADEKPQAKEETDNPPEETYVDALTLRLNHSTTDIYLPVPASDLALSVRRDLSGEVVSERDLYFAQARPDRPFGAGWSSNLTPHLRIESTLTTGTNSFYYDRYVYAVDHNGSEHRFVVKITNKVPTQNLSSPLAMILADEIVHGDQVTFDALPSSLLEADAGQNTLTLNSDGTYELKLKNGTRVRYLSPSSPFQRSINSYIKASAGGEPCVDPVEFIDVGGVTRLSNRFHRASQVIDPKGATLDYVYDTSGLIPSEIRANNSLVQRLMITQTGGRISQITDPRGNAYDYTYSSLPATDGFASRAVLQKVRRPAIDQAGDLVRPETLYTYEAFVQADPTPKKLQSLDPTGAEDPISTLHVNLHTLTDARGAAYTFNYVPDLSVLAYADTPDFKGHYPVNSRPRLISSIGLPGGTSSQFSRAGNLTCSYGMTRQGRPYAMLDPVSSGGRVTSVVAADTSRRSYAFQQPSLLPVIEQNINISDDPQYPPVFIAHGRMVITHKNASNAVLGTESVDYNFLQSPGPVKVTDFSGGQTHFGYGQSLSLGPVSLIGFKSAFTSNPEPTSQTNALGHTKSFIYDSEWWAMRSSTDEAGVKTEYLFDKDVSLTNLGRRVAEIIRAPAVGSTPGPIVQRTDFAYGSTTFPGFMTARIVRALSGAGDPAWTTDLTTLYVPDANGRISQEVTDLNANGTVDSADLVTAYTYDNNGNKLTVTDPRGNVTTFVYDALNRVVETIFPDSTPGTLADNPRSTVAYDLNGNRVRTTDENGVITFTTYDVLNRVATQTLDLNGNGTADARPTDLVTSYTYTPLNARAKVTDPRGTETLFEYDALQRLIKKTDDFGTGRLNYVTTYAYELAKNPGASVFDTTGWKPTLATDPRGYRTRVTYDKLFRPLSEQAEYATNVYATTTKTYDPVGNLLTVTDPLGMVMQTTYDSLRRPLTVKEAFGTTLEATTTKAYTSTGLAWKTVDPLARETTTQYDAAGRPVKTYAPAVDDALTIATTLVSPVTETIYDAAGNVSAVINPLGHRTDYTYDARNRRVTEQQPSVTDATTGLAARPTRTTTYDDVGNVLETEDARGNITTTDYDRARRPLTITAPKVQLLDSSYVHPVTTMTYDAAGNVLTLADANSRVTTNTYDALDRLKTTTQSPTASSADNIVVTNEYDPAGNRTAVIDGKAQRTEFTYDGLNRNLTVKDPANRSVTFTYNALNKTARVDSLSQRTEYTYDARHRLTDVNYIGRTADNRTYAYDVAGQLMSVTEPGKSGKADVAYSYDALGRQLTETSRGKTHAYTYDLANNRITVTYGGTGTVLTSTYDVLNRLATLTENGRVTTYGYDLNGNRVFQQLPNGEETETTFDALNRQTGIITLKNGGGTLLELTQVYDLVGNVVRINESYPGSTLSGRKVTNAYDHVNRLIDELNQESAKTVATTYVYDQANNRTGKTVETTVSGITTSGTTTYTFNNLNQLVSFGGAANHFATYSYDFNGNRALADVSTQTSDDTITTKHDTYQYDYENRLVRLNRYPGQYISSPSASYAYTYDYRTRRIERTENSTTTKLVFSGGVSVSEYDGGTPAVASAEYIRGSDWGGGVGGLLYSVRSGTPSFKHYNSRGDVISETNTAGTATWEGTYEAFGTRTQEVGSTQDRQKANTKEEDPTGLLNEGFRYRDLETGVFITRDPLGFVDGPNMYAYVVQNPWSKFDPEGLQGTPARMPAARPAPPDPMVVLMQARANLVTLQQNNGNGRALRNAERNYIRAARSAGIDPFNPQPGGPSNAEFRAPGTTPPPPLLQFYRSNNDLGPITNPNGRNGSPSHQSDVAANNNGFNPPLQPGQVGNRVPDGVGQPGQSGNVRGVNVTPGSPSARVITESEGTLQNGQVNSAGRRQIRDVRDADPAATIVVTDHNRPSAPPIIYPPSTQPPPGGRLPPGTPTHVPAPAPQEAPAPPPQQPQSSS